MHVSKRAFLVLGFSLVFCVPSEHVSKYPFVFGAAAGGAREKWMANCSTHMNRELGHVAVIQILF